MSFLRTALTDEQGQWDVAYIGIGVLVAMILGAIPWILLMTTIALAAGKAFDPQPLGVAIGAICGGFGVALGALAGYMGTTRPRHEGA